MIGLAGHTNYSTGAGEAELQDPVDFRSHHISGKYCQKSKHCRNVTIAGRVKIATTNPSKWVLCRIQIWLITRDLTAYTLQNTLQRKKISCIITSIVQKGNWGIKKSTDLPLLTWHVYGRAKSQVQFPNRIIIPSPYLHLLSEQVDATISFLTESLLLQQVFPAGAAELWMVQHWGFAKELLSGHALLPALQVQFSQGSQVPLIHTRTAKFLSLAFR